MYLNLLHESASRVLLPSDSYAGQSNLHSPKLKKPQLISGKKKRKLDIQNILKRKQGTRKKEL